MSVWVWRIKSEGTSRSLRNLKPLNLDTNKFSPFKNVSCGRPTIWRPSESLVTSLSFTKLPVNVGNPNGGANLGPRTFWRHTDNYLGSSSFRDLKLKFPEYNDELDRGRRHFRWSAQKTTCSLNSFFTSTCLPSSWTANALLFYPTHK